jgi:hypothetical protein
MTRSQWRRSRWTGVGLLAGLLPSVLAAPGALGSDTTVTAGSFAFTQYASLSPVDGWTIVAGQFAGDPRTDIAAYHPGDGSIWVGQNTG